MPLEADMLRALKEKPFHLFYQFPVDTRSNPLEAEGLIRWAHPQRGMVSPAVFIPLTEQSGHRADRPMGPRRGRGIRCPPAHPAATGRGWNFLCSTHEAVPEAPHSQPVRE